MARAEQIKKEHSLTLKDRETLSMSGITEVVSFSDSSLTLRTSCGDLLIRGDKLNIGQLNTETGELCVSGRVVFMRYSKGKKKGGVFEGLFR